MPTNLPTKKDFVTVSDAAKILGVSIDTIRRWDAEGKITSERLDGKNRFFTKSSLREFKKNMPLSISEAASVLSVSVSTLRRLEKKGSITAAARTAKGDRLYKPADLKAFLENRQPLKKQTVGQAPQGMFEPIVGANVVSSTPLQASTPRQSDQEIQRSGVEYTSQINVDHPQKKSRFAGFL